MTVLSRSVVEREEEAIDLFLNSIVEFTDDLLSFIDRLITEVPTPTAANSSGNLPLPVTPILNKII
jgi:hypothetical protein